MVIIGTQMGRTLHHTLDDLSSFASVMSDNNKFIIRKSCASNVCYMTLLVSDYNENDGKVDNGNSFVFSII